MKKVFVLIKVNNRDSYKPFCDFVNSIHNLTFQILWDYKFQYYCEIGFDSGHLIYIDEANKDEFICAISKNNIPFEIKDLSEKYDEWINKCSCKKVKLDDSFLDNEPIIEPVLEVEIPQIIELPDGSQLLTEEEIVRKDGIKLYTHSNEQCGHHIPHIHVYYNGDKNYRVLSLKNFEVIEPSKCDKRAKIKKCVELLKENINDARLAWNRTSGNIKFKINNGIALDETYDSSKE